MKALLITFISTISLSSYASIENLADHTMRGIEVGYKAVSIEKGETSKEGTYVCDYISKEEKTLLEDDNGVLKYLVRRYENHYCEEYTEEYILIEEKDEIKREMVAAMSGPELKEVQLKFDNVKKELSFLIDGKKQSLDLSNVKTPEGLEAALSGGGRSTNGEFITNYKLDSFEVTYGNTLPDISGVKKICDERLDSDQNDDAIYYGEICKEVN